MITEDERGNNRVLPFLCYPYRTFSYIQIYSVYYLMAKGKAVPLQAWGGPEGSRKLRFPDFLTTAQDGGKVVSLTQRPHLPTGNTPVRETPGP
jgi:hypothetical protein